MALHIVEYEPGAPGCPVHLNGTGSPDWTWNAFNPELGAATPAADYVFRTTHRLVDFDVWDIRWMASERFLEVCRRFDIGVEGVPVAVIQSGGRPTSKQYFFLRWSSWASVIDRERSEVEWATDLRTGEPHYHRFFPKVPIVETVATFVIDESRIPPTAAFQCLDLGHGLVCTDEFRQACEDAGLTGLRFRELSTYTKTDFWG